jgi:hypothetical protein
VHARVRQLRFAVAALTSINTSSATSKERNPRRGKAAATASQTNPKEWTYIQGLPRERLERMLVLQNVNKIERRVRVRASVMKQLEANPELKEAYRKLVKNLPAEQQERAMMSIAARTLRTVAPRQPQQQQSQGARV